MKLFTHSINNLDLFIHYFDLFGNVLPMREGLWSMKLNRRVRAGDKKVYVIGKSSCGTIRLQALLFRCGFLSYDHNCAER